MKVSFLDKNCFLTNGGKNYEVNENEFIFSSRAPITRFFEIQLKCLMQQNTSICTGLRKFE